MKSCNKSKNAVNIHFGASSKSVFCLLKSSTRLLSFHVTKGYGSTNCDLTLRHKFLLSNKEKKPMFLIVFWSDMHFGFVDLFFGCPIWRACKIACPENGGGETNLSSPNIKIPYRQKFLWSEISEIFPIFTYFLETAKIFIFWKLPK